MCLKPTTLKQCLVEKVSAPSVRFYFDADRNQTKVWLRALLGGHDAVWSVAM